MPEDVTLDEMFERVQKQRDNAARTAAELAKANTEIGGRLVEAETELLQLREERDRLTAETSRLRELAAAGELALKLTRDAFQPDGLLYGCGAIKLGESCLVHGLPWLIDRAVRLQRENRALVVWSIRYAGYLGTTEGHRDAPEGHRWWARGDGGHITAETAEGAIRKAAGLDGGAARTETPKEAELQKEIHSLRNRLYTAELAVEAVERAQQQGAGQS